MKRAYLNCGFVETLGSVANEETTDLLGLEFSPNDTLLG